MDGSRSRKRTRLESLEEEFDLTLRAQKLLHEINELRAETQPTRAQPNPRPQPIHGLPTVPHLQSTETAIPGDAKNNPIFLTRSPTPERVATIKQEQSTEEDYDDHNRQAMQASTGSPTRFLAPDNDAQEHLTLAGRRTKRKRASKNKRMPGAAAASSWGPVIDEDPHYQSVIQDGDDMIELHCYKCVANAFKLNGKLYFFAGARGIKAHIRRAHPDDDWRGLSIDDVIQLCKKRTLSEREADAVLHKRHKDFEVTMVVADKADPKKTKK